MPIFTSAKEALDYVDAHETEGVKCMITTTVFGEYKVLCSIFTPSEPVIAREKVTPIPIPVKQEKIIEHGALSLRLKELYGYQEDAVTQALRDRHITIEIPTGKGKTNVALAIINRLKQPAIILVPTLILMEQWIHAITMAGGSATSVSGTGVKFSPLTVITYASATRYINEIAKYHVVVFDEVHHLFAPEYRKIILALREAGTDYLIGLTATAREFGEEKELQDKLFPNRFVRTMASFQQNAETSVPIELTEQGVQMTEEETEKYDGYTDNIRNALRRFGDIAGIQRGMKSEFPELRKQATLGMSSIARRKVLLSEMTPKMDEAVRIIRDNTGQIIVFAESIESAEYIHNSLLQLGVSSALIHSNLKSNRLIRERIMNDLKSGKTRVLVGVISISEGIDLPDLSQAIILSPSVAGRRQYVQRLGRILRHKTGKRAHLWVLYASGTVEERNLVKIRNIVGLGGLP